MTRQRQTAQEADAERIRLVRLCTAVTGSLDAAEDLVQETLLEAWRHEQQLRDPERRSQWLAGIARNVCRRWWRRHQKESGRIHRVSAAEYEAALLEEDELELGLEREDLSVLLDRALTLLPPSTRNVLVGRYVEELPASELAERIGVQPGMVAVRLHRGRLALRRVLATELRDEAVAFGLSLAPDGGFQRTRIWCPICGQRRLMGRLDHEVGELALRCEGCCRKRDTDITRSRLPHVFDGVTSYRASLSRAARFLHEYNWSALAHREAVCMSCGRGTAVRTANSEDLDLWPRGEPGVFMRCTNCGGFNYSPLRFMVLGMPEVQRFWRNHPRLRLLPIRHVERDGSPALLLGAESVTGDAEMDVLCAQDTYRVLDVLPSRR